MERCEFEFTITFKEGEGKTGIFHLLKRVLSRYNPYDPVRLSYVLLEFEVTNAPILQSNETETIN
jgi:hypothetical protein